MKWRQTRLWKYVSSDRSWVIKKRIFTIGKVWDVFHDDAWMFRAKSIRAAKDGVEYRIEEDAK